MACVNISCHVHIGCIIIIIDLFLMLNAKLNALRMNVIIIIRPKLL